MNLLTKLTVLDLQRLFTLKTHLQGLISTAEIALESNKLELASMSCLSLDPNDKMSGSYQRLEDLGLVKLRSDSYHSRYYLTGKGDDLIRALLSHSHVLLLPERP
jgi:hypothetical protein